MTGSSPILTAKIALLCVVGFTTLASALTPWFAAGCLATRKALDFIRVAAAASAGIIVGTLLCHMLPHATEAFSSYLAAAYPDADPHDHEASASLTAGRRLAEEVLETSEQRIVHYPWAHMICGAMLLLLLVIDFVFSHGLGGHSHGHSHGGGDAGASSVDGHIAGGHDHVTGGVVALGQAMEASKAAAPGDVTIAVHDGRSAASEAAAAAAAAVGASGLPSDKQGSPSRAGSGGPAGLPQALTPHAEGQEPCSGGGSRSSSASGSSSAATAAGSSSRNSCGSSGALLTSDGSPSASASGTTAATDSDAVAAIAEAAAIVSVAPGQISAAARTGSSGAAAGTDKLAQMPGSSAGHGSGTVAASRRTSSSEESDEASSAYSSSDEIAPPSCRESCVAVLGCSRTTRDHKMALLVGQSAGSQRQLRVRAWVFAMAMSIHAVFDGLGVGVQTTAGGFSSLIAAVFVHKIFDGLSLGATVFLGDLPPCQRWFLLLLTSSLTPIGIGIGIAVVETADTMALELATGIILSLAAGSFAFIGLIELLPSALADGRLMPLKLGVFGLGYLIMAIIAAWA